MGDEQTEKGSKRGKKSRALESRFYDLELSLPKCSLSLSHTSGKKQLTDRPGFLCDAARKGEPVPVGRDERDERREGRR